MKGRKEMKDKVFTKALPNGHVLYGGIVTMKFAKQVGIRLSKHELGAKGTDFTIDIYLFRKWCFLNYIEVVGNEL